MDRTEIRMAALNSSLEIEESYMRAALVLARQAGEAGEVPVGAIIVSNGQIIGRGTNKPIAAKDPTAHAEIEALRQAARVQNNYRLTGCTLYVTLEPCAMCAGAIVIARINRLVYAARDLRFGAVRSKFRLADSELLNHQVETEEGLLAAESAELLTQFFRERR
jgi:tRNA(adenine34) deaminase